MKRYSDQKPFDDPSATHDVVVESELKSSANPELVVPPEDRVKAYPVRGGGSEGCCQAGCCFVGGRMDTPAELEAER